MAKKTPESSPATVPDPAPVAIPTMAELEALASQISTLSKELRADFVGLVKRVEALEASANVSELDQEPEGENLAGRVARLERQNGLRGR